MTVNWKARGQLVNAVTFDGVKVRGGVSAISGPGYDEGLTPAAHALKRGG